MALKKETKPDPYEIASPLGAGGVGDVCLSMGMASPTGAKPFAADG